MNFLKKHLKFILSSALVLALIGGGIGYYVWKNKFAEKDDYVKHCYSANRLYHLFAGFNEDYMGMPGPEAVEMDPELVGFDFSSSNGYLGQLLVAMNADSEELFFLKGSSVCPGEHADNKVAPNKEALRAGENGWAYFKNRDLNSAKKQPLLVPGWNPATKKWDDPVWENGIPVLFTDGSVVLFRSGSNKVISSENAWAEYATSTEDLPFELDDPNLIQPLTK